VIDADPPAFNPETKGSPEISIKNNFMQVADDWSWTFLVAEKQVLSLPIVLRWTQWAATNPFIEINCADADLCEYITYISASPETGSHYLEFWIPPTF
jgi:hypothetical protein